MNKIIFLKRQKIAIMLFVIGGALLSLFLYQYFASAPKNLFSQTEDTISFSAKALGISFDYNPDVFVISDQATDNNATVLVVESDDLHIVMKQYDDLNIFYKDTPLRSDGVSQDFFSLERWDRSGFFGYKLRNINSEAKEEQPHVIYRSHRGDKILEIVCQLKTRENIKALEKEIDNLVTQIRFDEGGENQLVFVKQSVLFFVEETQKKYLMEYEQSTASTKYLTDTVVANKTMDIEVPYDSQFISMTNNHDAEIYGGPELRFNGEGINIVIREESIDFPYVVDTGTDVLRMSNLMAITRFDHSGYAGQRRWSWLIQNEQKGSRIEYRIKRNDKILVVDAWIENADPESADFLTVQSHVDALVSGMKIGNVSNLKYFTFIAELGVKVDSGLFNNNF